MEISDQLKAGVLEAYYAKRADFTWPPKEGRPCSKIAAIVYYRAQTHVSLISAKEAVEEIVAEHEAAVKHGYNTTGYIPTGGYWVATLLIPPVSGGLDLRSQRGQIKRGQWSCPVYIGNNSSEYAKVTVWAMEPDCEWVTLEPEAPEAPEAPELTPDLVGTGTDITELF